MPRHPDRSVAFQVRTLSNLFKRHVDGAVKELNHDAMTRMHGWAVGYLYDNRGRDVFQRDFESRFSIRRSTATRIFQRMERDGLLVRQPVPGDARLKKLVLTEKAVRSHREFIGVIDRLERHAMRGITSEERKTFFRVVERLKANLE